MAAGAGLAADCAGALRFFPLTRATAGEGGATAGTGFAFALWCPEEGARDSAVTAAARPEEAAAAGNFFRLANLDSALEAITFAFAAASALSRL